MKRYLLFPICIVLVAVAIRFFEGNEKSSNKLPQKNVNQVPKTIEAANKKYTINILKYEISNENSEVNFTVNFASNFPKKTYIQTQLIHTSSLRKVVVSQKPCDMDKMMVEYGPFLHRELPPGNFKIVAFYSPSANAPEELQAVNFTEASYDFYYGNAAEYEEIYSQRYVKSQKLLSDIQALYSASKKKYYYFKKQNLNAGDWHVWKDRWQKSFEFTRDQERIFYETGYVVPLFPIMRKSIALINIMKDLVTVDYLNAIEKNKDVPPYREVEFEELFLKIENNLIYEMIAMAPKGQQQKLISEYNLFSQKCNEMFSAPKFGKVTIAHRENFLLDMLELQKKYMQMQKVEQEYFIEYSNQLLLDTKSALYGNIRQIDGKSYNDFTSLYMSFLYQWYTRGVANKLIKKIPTFLPSEPFSDVIENYIVKWNLRDIPQQSMHKIFDDLLQQISNIRKIINKQGNLQKEVNNIIIWQSEFVNRQEKNQKLLKIDHSLKMKNLTNLYARFSMEMLIFMEDAKEQKDKKVLLKTINDIFERLKQSRE
ncbi:hypothetical protein [Candidatus Uabimicrobium sp. HlEnr_7]|uniref:hypothetical protein n=1 Tax=Candidatus Uabimicrobium helgolandensis TaxID=3095367 RepID=UPI003557AA77